MTRRHSATEAGLPAEIVRALASVGVRALRLNSGSLRVGNRCVRLCPAGTPDLLVIDPYLWIECKRRDGKGELSPEQIEFRDWCASRGVPWCEVKSVGEAVRAVNEERARR